jgi:hypothetical protein
VVNTELIGSSPHHQPGTICTSLHVSSHNARRFDAIFCTHMLSAARKPDAIMQRNEADSHGESYSEASPDIFIDAPFFLLCITILASIYIYYQLFIFCLRVYATGWVARRIRGHEKSWTIIIFLHAHFSSVLRNLNRNTFISIGQMMKRN